MAAGNQTRRILIKVDTSESRGLREIAEQMGLLNKNTKSLSGNLSFLTNVFKGWLGYLGTRELMRLSDEMQNITNRLKIFTGSAEGARAALGEIAGIADRTQQSVKEVGEVYSRIATSLKGSGASTQELVTLTESLINTFRVAGATTAETSNTIIQLSQAFSSGQLRGQELRSVMEQNATLAGQLREKFGQDIYKKAEQGAIKVTDVLEVLAANQKKVNEEANKLAPTFEQTLTKSMNSVALAVNDLNQQFGLSAKFAAVMGFAMENLSNILIVVGGVVTVLAVQRLPALIKGLQALRVAAIAFAAANPLLLAFTALVTAGLLVYNNWDKLVRLMKLFKAAALDLAADIGEYLIPPIQKLGSFLGVDISKKFNVTKKSIDDLRTSAKQIRKEIEEGDKKTAGPAAPTADDADKNMASLIEKLKNMSGQSEKVKKVKEILGELNKAFQSGAISINEYNAKLIDFQLYKLNREFAEGKMDIFKYHEGLRDLNIAQLSRELAAGTISLQEFNAAVGEEKFKVLTEQVDAGRISLEQYNAELGKLEDKVRPGNAFEAGIQSYINSVGTLSQNIAKGVEQTFGHLEKSFLDFIKTGKFNFRDFAQAVLDDLNAIIVRSLIIRPIAQGILGAVSGGASADAGSAGGSYTDYSGYAAKGMAFDSGVRKFAKGGIVDGPTAFTYGGHGQNKGLMGEAGTEAILPLARGANGDLGVQASVTPVTINIVNNSSAEVTERESTGPDGGRLIEVLINNKVKEAISTGKFDQAFKSSFGLQRKGV